MRLHSFERIKEILTPYVLIAFLASCAEEELFSSDIEELSVDLGLSVIWSIHNVGANSPEEYGGYYAWGELEEKMIYSWFDYKYGSSDISSDGVAIE